jgi:TRAP-type C4-dicarboxylate transport system permease small subunit
MSANIGLAGYAEVEVDNAERLHRTLVYIAAGAMVLLILFLAIYGFDYYRLSGLERPFSTKHALLKPSGRIGIKLGLLGVGLFFLIFFYAIRKRIVWLSRKGTAKHWLDFHVVAGCSAPLVIAFHSAFKFHGIAGVAFVIMLAVALSGIIGRYLYAQIPQSLNSVDASLMELQQSEAELTRKLSEQHLISAKDLEPLLRIPTAERATAMPAYRAILLMLALDLMRPFRVARLRLKVLHWGGFLTSLGGLLPTSHADLEEVISTVRRKSKLSKRVVFLNQTQQLFHLWHVVHRPFSYSFAILATIHIAIVFTLGYL